MLQPANPAGNTLIVPVRGDIARDCFPMIQKKICILGAFATGKTSLVQRFVKGIFSESYLTTVGVKIDKKGDGNRGSRITSHSVGSIR